MNVDEINRLYVAEVRSAKLHTSPGHVHRAVLVMNARARRRNRVRALGIRVR